MSFSNDIKKFNEKTQKAATNVFRGTALSLMNKIVLRTPVDTGRLRGNWFSSINRASNQVDGNGERYTSTTGKAKLSDSIFFVNNLPYAQVIEDGDGNRPPHGMVKVTIAEFQQVVRQNARKARKS